MPENEVTEVQADADSGAGDEAATETKATAESGDLGDGGKKAIESEREARKIAERNLREAQKSLKEYEDRDKTELQRALERAEAAEKTAAEAQFNALRSKVSALKGVPVSSLNGQTEEELIQSADELISWRDQNRQQQIEAVQPAKQRSVSPVGGLRSGASNKENTNPDPKARAADALRRLRQSG